VLRLEPSSWELKAGTPDVFVGKGELELIVEPRVVKALISFPSTSGGPGVPILQFGSKAHQDLLARAVLVWLIDKAAKGSQKVEAPLSVVIAAFPSLALLRRDAVLDVLHEVANLIADPSGSIQVRCVAPLSNHLTAGSWPPSMCANVVTSSTLALHCLLPQSKLDDLHACEAPVLHLAGLLAAPGKGGWLGSVYRQLRRAMFAPQLVVSARPSAVAIAKLLAEYRWGEEPAASQPAQLIADFGLALGRWAAPCQQQLRAAIAAASSARGGSKSLARALPILVAAIEEMISQKFETESSTPAVSGASPLTAELSVAANDELLDELFGPTTSEPPSGRTSAVDVHAEGRSPKKLTVYNQTTGAVDVVTDAEEISRLWEELRHLARRGGVPKCELCGGPVHAAEHCLRPLRQASGSRAFTSPMPLMGPSDDSRETNDAEVIVPPSGGPARVQPAGRATPAGLCPELQESREQMTMIAVNERSRMRKSVAPLSSILLDVLFTAKREHSVSGKVVRQLESACALCESGEAFLSGVGAVLPAADPLLGALRRLVASLGSEIDAASAAEAERRMKRRREEPPSATASGRRRPAGPPAAEEEPMDVAPLVAVRVRRPPWVCQHCGLEQECELHQHYEQCLKLQH
jgi:hypothetical protein